MADIRWAMGKMDKGEKVTCDDGVNVLFKEGDDYRREKRNNTTELRISNRELKNKDWKVHKIAKAKKTVTVKATATKRKKKTVAKKKAA
jgi:hypothetical protein